MRMLLTAFYSLAIAFSALGQTNTSKPLASGGWPEKMRAWSVGLASEPHALASDPTGGAWQSSNYMYSGSAGETPGSTYLITTVAGTVLPATAVSGTSVSSISMCGVATDSAGNAYFAARYRNAIFKLNTGGILTLVAGNGTPGFSGDGGAATGAGRD